ncbi:MAG: GHKL domain-containing protein [Erysipelotrichaceae bacterium]|nr:GHKL domain-containing protein [Erysipelotrichaceae bacterium]
MTDILITLVFIVIIILMTIYYLIALRRKNENELLEASMDDMMLLYNQIQNEIEATKRFRHDISKHIRTLEYIMNTRESNQLQETYDELLSSYKQMPAYSTNEVINGILSIKAEECESKGIFLTIDVDDGPLDNYKPVDLVALIYNLLDNAIEAAINTEDKHVAISLRLASNQLIIHSENSSQKFTIRTTKNPNRHGVGTIIIQDVIKRYNGTFNIDFKDQLVIQDITLNQPVAES